MPGSRPWLAATLLKQRRELLAFFGVEARTDGLLVRDGDPVQLAHEPTGFSREIEGVVAAVLRVAATLDQPSFLHAVDRGAPACWGRCRGGRRSPVGSSRLRCLRAGGNRPGAGSDRGTRSAPRTGRWHGLPAAKVGTRRRPRPGRSAQWRCRPQPADRGARFSVP